MNWSGSFHKKGIKSRIFTFQKGISFSMKTLFLCLMITISLNSFSQWVSLPSGETHHIKSIHFINDTLGFYCGGSYPGPSYPNYCYIRKTTDCGQTWTFLYSDNTPFTKVYFLNEDIGFSKSWSSHIKKTINGGTFWFESLPSAGVFSAGTSFQVFDIYHLAYFGYADSLYLSSDSGLSWTKRGFPHRGLNGYFIASFNDLMTGFATGDSDIYKTTDGGLSWTLSLNTNQEKVTFIKFVNDSVGFAMKKFSLMRTADQGQSWSQVYSSSGNYMYSIAFRNNYILACGQNGTIISSDDNGLTWQTEIIPSTNQINDVWITNSAAYAVGDNGTLLKKCLSLQNTKQSTNSSDILIFPNPVSELLSIHTGSGNLKTVEIKNVHGQTLMIFPVRDNQITSMQELPAGIYFLQVKDEKQITTLKFLKIDQ